MKPKILVFPNHSDVGFAAALFIAAEVTLNPKLVLGLPTYKTPIPMYNKIYEFSKYGNISAIPKKGNPIDLRRFAK